MKIQNFGKPLSRLIIMVAICMLSFHAMAYDFSYTHQGKTLYYNITQDNTIEVTCYSHSIYDNDNNYAINNCSRVKTILDQQSKGGDGSVRIYRPKRNRDVNIKEKTISNENKKM